MTPAPATPALDVLVIGGGQAGLAMGYHLAQRGLRFQIVDAGAEVGAAWRSRWDSLRAVHPSPVRQPAGTGLPSRARHLPRQRRRRRLPAGLRGTLRAAGAARHHGDLTDPKQRRLRRQDESGGVGGPAGRGRHRALPGAVHPADRRGA